MDAFEALSGPVLFAHRGARLRAPENSLAALALALEEGADAFEIDVHVTKDGHVVVAHDPTGTRTARVDRAIAECTLGEVRAWDVGSGVGVTRGAGPTRMPTLDEVLEAFATTPLNVDIKAHGGQAWRAVVATVARHGAEQRVLLTSFSSRVLRELRAAGYCGPTGCGQGEAVRAVFAPEALLRALPMRGRRLQIPTRYAGLALDRPELARKLHGLGVRLDYWVVNDAVQAQRLLALGADGIVTDDPAAMAACFARSSHGTAWRARHPQRVG